MQEDGNSSKDEETVYRHIKFARKLIFAPSLKPLRIPSPPSFTLSVQLSSHPEPMQQRTKTRLQIHAHTHTLPTYFSLKPRARNAPVRNLTNLWASATTTTTTGLLVTFSTPRIPRAPISEPLKRGGSASLYERAAADIVDSNQILRILFEWSARETRKAPV